jgi:hypothetical protein
MKCIIVIKFINLFRPDWFIGVVRYSKQQQVSKCLALSVGLRIDYLGGKADELSSGSLLALPSLSTMYLHRTYNIKNVTT